MRQASWDYWAGTPEGASMKKKRVQIFVRGRVQGVFFRQSALQEAQARSLDGWVKNLPNGEVEAVAEGAPPDVDAFIAWCHRGPKAARVSEVVVRDMPEEQPLRSFH